VKAFFKLEAAETSRGCTAAFVVGGAVVVAPTVVGGAVVDGAAVVTAPVVAVEPLVEEPHAATARTRITSKATAMAATELLRINVFCMKDSLLSVALYRMQYNARL
jgi:hypothetical protein